MYDCASVCLLDYVWLSEMSVHARGSLRACMCARVSLCLCGNDYISLLQPYDWSVSVWFDSVCLGAPAEAVTLCEGERKREREKE